MKRLWSLLLLTALLLCACSDGGEFGADSSDSTASAVSAASDIAKEESDLFTDRDYDDSYDESGSVHITASAAIPPRLIRTPSVFPEQRSGSPRKRPM